MKTTIPFFITMALLSSCTQPEKQPGVQKQATYIETAEFATLNMPFSQAVIYGDIIYLSGQVGEIGTEERLVEGGIGPETRQAMLNIKEVLE
jgi:enamine deaminase RidA (YjgF/YER057c/UK114 family)